MQFFLGTFPADSTLLRSLPKRRICNVTDGYQVWIKSLLQIDAITSEKYIQPNARVSLGNRCWSTYTATYVQLGEETAKVFSQFFHLFPFPMLPAASAPSLPSPSQPKSSSTDPPGRPSGTLLPQPQYGVSVALTTPPLAPWLYRTRLLYLLNSARVASAANNF